MATVNRLDVTSAHAARQLQKPHVTPVGRVLRLLGIESAALDNATVTVEVQGLVFLLRELARHQPFDPEFYAESYPDIEEARMVGKIPDLHEHFIETGFIEGRLPAEPPFDPVWYAHYYPDIAKAIPANDVQALRNHFITAGLIEGRAGTPSSLNGQSP